MRDSRASCRPGRQQTEVCLWALRALFGHRHARALSALATRRHGNVALGHPSQILGIPAQWCYHVQAGDFVQAVARMAAAPAGRVQRALESLLLTPDWMKRWDPSRWKEIRKRPGRLAVRPVVALPSADGMQCLIGPFLAYQAMNVLLGSAVHGTWPVALPGSARAAAALEARRKKLSDRMERVAAEICERHCEATYRRLDLHDRFPKAAFPDLGDYDVFGVSTAKRTVTVLEAKHWAPTFVPKDEAGLRRRLTEAVQKHTRRVTYLTGNLQKVLSSLIPGTVATSDWQVSDAVVCSDLIVASIGEQVAPGVRFLTHEELEEWFQQQTPA